MDGEEQKAAATFLQNLGTENDMWIFVGVHSFGRNVADLPMNSLMAIPPNGSSVSGAKYTLTLYDKIHLFDQHPSPKSTGNSKVEMLQESKSTGRGRQTPPCVEIPSNIAARVGMAICYDLRFPELSQYLVRQFNANIITYPSAFTVPTGRDHWEVLIRARAIECQSFVVAPAQIGQHNADRCSWGGSMASI